MQQDCDIEEPIQFYSTYFPKNLDYVASKVCINDNIKASLYKALTVMIFLLTIFLTVGISYGDSKYNLWEKHYTADAEEKCNDKCRLYRTGIVFGSIFTFVGYLMLVLSFILQGPKDDSYYQFYCVLFICSALSQGVSNLCFYMLDDDNVFNVFSLLFGVFILASIVLSIITSIGVIIGILFPIYLIMKN